MDRVSAAILGACFLFGVVFATLSESFGQTPDMILGTDGGAYELFTPEQVVAAGGGSGGGETAYKFFEKESLSVPTVTTDMAIPSSGRGLVQTWLAKKTFSKGLIVGPFHTFYEGEITLDVSTTSTVVLSLTTVHTFSSGQSLSTTRTQRFRAPGNEFQDAPLSRFSTITELALGTVQADDGTDIVITPELLAQPVDISIVAEYQLERRGARTTGDLEGLTSVRPAVTFWQLSKTTPGDAGDLSDRLPRPLGTQAAGTGTEASRSDHVHPVTGVAKSSDLTAFETRIEADLLRAERVGIAEFTGRTDQDFLDSMKLAQNAGEIEAGDKFYQASATLTYSGKVLRYNGVTIPTNPDAADLLDYFVVLNLGTATSGSTAFTGLSDTPANYTGSGGKFVAVNSGATALEFVNAPSGGGGASLSDKTPKPLGTAAAGTGTAGSRDDHVHLLPAEIAGNTTQIAANNQSINRNHTAITANRTAITAVKSTADTNATVKNPALASATAGYLVRQKSDHSAYEAVEPHAAVLSGLPDIAGHGGNVLKVNSAESGLEWGAGGGGGNGGGGISFTKIGTILRVGSRVTTSFDRTFTEAGVGDRCRNADLIMVESKNPHMSRGTFGRPRIAASATSGAAFNAFLTSTDAGPNSIYIACAATGDTVYARVEIADPFAQQVDYQAYAVNWSGGGGGDGPSIPKPSSAGAGEFLRVNAAGAAYELAAIERYELPGPQASPVLAETQIPYNAGAVGHSLETGFDLDDVPDGPVYIRVTDPDHNTGVYSIWTTRAALMSLTAIPAGNSGSQVIANHVILRNQSGQAAGYFAGRITGTNDLWVSAPATHASGGTLHATAVSESGWAEYAVARNAPEDFPGYGNVLAIKTGASIQGSAKTVARSDHQHAVPGALYGSPVDVGSANAAGSATTLARSDHVHKGATVTSLATTDAQVGLNTQNIEANTAKITALSKETVEKLWTHAATGTQWAAGQGRNFASGVNAKLWAGFDGTAPGWKNLWGEVKYRVAGSPGTSHYGTIVFGTHRDADQTADDVSRIWGSGFINGTLLHAVINLPQETSFNSQVGSLHIDNCGFCTQGTESLEVTLWGGK